MTDGMKRFAAAAMAAAVALTSAGCSSMQTTQKNIESVTQRTMDLKESVLARTSSATVQRTQRPRLAGEEVLVRPAVALPPIFAKEVTFTTHGQSLAEALETVSSIIGVTIRGTEITVAESGGSATAAAPGSPIAGQVRMEFRGRVRALLDDLAARSNASWRYVPGKNMVEFYRFETRTISVNVPAGPKQVAAAISLAGVSGGGGSAASGAGNVSVSQSLNVDPWGALMRGVQSILADGATGPAGGAQAAAAAAGSVLSASGPAGQASASPELGLVTITARPAVMDRVVAYLNSINARFAHNVLVDVKIYSLSMDTQASLGFSLDALYNRLNRYGVSVVGASPLQPATGTPGQITIKANNPNSRWNGSQLVAQALSQFGNVALQTQGQVLAVNGQPSPIQVANEVNYLASSATTQTPNVGSTTTLTPGTRVVGFTANFIPLILGNNQILLNYQMQISSLTALTQIVSGNSSIQTPQIASQSLQQSAYMRDGEAIVLFGFDQSRDTLDSAINPAGASRATHTQRQMVVIVIQVNGGTRNVA